MEEFLPIILAAGKGSRMRSDLPKALHPLLGRPLLMHVVRTLKELDFKKIVVVVGYKAEQIKASIEEDSLEFVEQKEQLGTGHALMCCKELWTDFKGALLVLNGDVPLLQKETLRNLMEVHLKEQAALTLLTAKVEKSGEYGVILRDKGGAIKGIAEITERENTSDPAEINAGVYCFKTAFLNEHLFSLSPNPKKGEYYLTDLIKIAAVKKEKIASYEAPFAEIIGINTRKDLALATSVLKQQVLEKHMLNGVTIVSPENTYIEMDVKIGRDTVIFPGVCLRGQTVIGKGCVLENGTVVVDSVIGNQVHIKPYSVITESKIEDHVAIGPFAHLRPGTHLATEARIGNFVEVKKSYVGRGSKASHLTYLGDAEIGEGVNIGAGTITCNYDGQRKHKTVIEDRAFIGSNTALVAPVKVGEGALIGAGSVITEDVPPETLAIARARQVHKPKKRR